MLLVITPRFEYLFTDGKNIWRQIFIKQIDINWRPKETLQLIFFKKNNNEEEIYDCTCFVIRWLFLLLSFMVSPCILMPCWPLWVELFVEYNENNPCVWRLANDTLRFVAFLLMLSLPLHSQDSIHIVTEWMVSDVSATKVRRAIRRGESVKYLVSDEVISYIRKHNLYAGPSAATTPCPEKKRWEGRRHKE